MEAEAVLENDAIYEVRKLFFIALFVVFFVIRGYKPQICMLKHDISDLQSNN